MKSVLRKLLVPLAFVALAPAVAAAQSKIPAGVYELVPDANFSAGFDVAGIVVEFTETTMTALQAGTVLVKSKLTYAADHVVLEDIEGQVACPGAAKYKVTISDKGVRIAPIEDPCPERGAVMAQVTMVKKG
jgi:hypothetical protein